MTKQKTDLRVIKTRRNLREAFIRLILRQGYDSTSIQDIADEAETARITFYRHYHDKESLLVDCLNQLYEDLNLRTQEMVKFIDRDELPAEIFFKHLEDQEELYRILFSSRGTHTVIEQLRQHLATYTLRSMENLEIENRPDVPKEIIAYHVASAQIGLGIWWLNHGKPYPSKYIAHLALWLSVNGIGSGLGLGHVDLILPQLDDEAHTSQ